MSTLDSSKSYLFLFRDPVDMPPPQPEQIAKLLTWIENLRKSDRVVAGSPLAPDPAKLVRGPRGQTVTDGPFAEAKEVFAGFLLVNAENLSEATRLAKSCPILAAGTSLEVRPVLPMAS